MKKLLALCLTIVLCLCCLASCGSAHKENNLPLQFADAFFVFLFEIKRTFVVGYGLNRQTALSVNFWNRVGLHSLRFRADVHYFSLARRIRSHSSG